MQLHTNTMFVKPKVKNIEFDNQIANQNDSIANDSKPEEENITSFESSQQAHNNVEFDNPITYENAYIANDTKLKKKKMQYHMNLLNKL